MNGFISDGDRDFSTVWAEDRKDGAGWPSDSRLLTAADAMIQRAHGACSALVWFQGILAMVQERGQTLVIPAKIIPAPQYADNA